METIVIIGGGFAGINLAKRLDAGKFRVKLVDRNNFHCFPPLFYQVASSGLDPSSIAFPFRRELKKHDNITYHMGHVKHIDLQAHTVTTSYETISFDRLVIAAGTRNNFFGIPDLDHTGFGIKTIGEASHTRDEILDRLERGAICNDPVRRRELLSFMVVGGGPSGVEIAGALGEMKRDVVPREYPELNPAEIRITLVEGTGRLLGAMSEKAQQRAYDDLRGLMVDVRLNTVLKNYSDKIVEFGDGSKEYWETLIWTAGVAGEPMPGLPDDVLGKGRRIVVDRYNRVKGYEDILFAIGDIALMKTERYPDGHPQMAQPAIQQAVLLASQLNKGVFEKEFEYADKGSMATIGKNKAVADLKKLTLSGFSAWIIWMAIHLVSILGMRNRISVFINWIWNYFSLTTSLRLLFRPTRYPQRRHWGD